MGGIGPDAWVTSPPDALDREGARVFEGWNPPPRLCERGKIDFGQDHTGLGTAGIRQYFAQGSTMIEWP